MNESLRRVLKWIRYALFFLFLAFLETSDLAFLSAFRPALLLSAVLSVSLCEGIECGTVFGLCAGIFGAAFGETGFSLLPLLYTGVGFFSGVIADRFDAGRKWLVFALLSALFSLLGEGVVFLRVNATWSDSVLEEVFRKLLLPGFLSTFLFSFPIFGVFLLLKGKK